jgi:hypothetical protein
MARTKRKGKFRNPNGVVDSTDYTPQLALPGSQDIIEIKEETWLQIWMGWGRNFVAFLLAAVLFFMVLYAGLSSTLMIFSATGPDSDRSAVVRGTWSETGGEPPIGSEAVISADTLSPDNWWEWIFLGYTGVSEPSVVKVLSKDYNTIAVNDNTSVNLAEDPNTPRPFVSSNNFNYNPESGPVTYKLKEEYLVECVSGTCAPGTTFIIAAKQIYGEVRK